MIWKLHKIYLVSIIHYIKNSTAVFWYASFVHRITPLFMLTVSCQTIEYIDIKNRMVWLQYSTKNIRTFFIYFHLITIIQNLLMNPPPKVIYHPPLVQSWKLCSLVPQASSQWGKGASGLQFKYPRGFLKHAWAAWDNWKICLRDTLKYEPRHAQNKQTQWNCLWYLLGL